MPETISYARSGEPIVSINGSFLHSRYDPRGEASRYVDSLNLGERTSIFLVIEPGLGYLVQALKEKRPGTTILVAHCSRFYGTPEVMRSEFQADGKWLPGGCAFESFLEAYISDFEADSVKIIEWKPSIGAYGRTALDLVSTAAVFLKRAAANARTVSQFGRKWFRNAINTASNAAKTLRVSSGDKPVAVAAAGPGLEACLPALRLAQENDSIFIVCVASALPALDAGKIQADIAVATDGGGWASFHLQTAARLGTPVASAFSAAIPSPLYSAPLLPIKDTSRWQTLIAAASKLHAFSAPQRGTVAATAVDVALALTSGPIYLAGFDLGVKLGRTHARPNALDRFHEDCAERLHPSASAAYTRFISTRDGGSLRIYAEWMSEHLKPHDSRIRVLGSASNALRSFNHADRIDPVGSVLPRLMSVNRDGGPESRRRFILESLREASIAEMEHFKRCETERRDLLEGRTLAGELLELLFFEEFAAAAKRKNGSIPLRFVIDSDEKINAALDALG